MSGPVALRHLELYFAGAEVPTWRKLLAAEQVPHVAINYLHLRPRITKQPWLLSDHFPEGQKIFLLSGASGTDRRHWNLTQHEEFLAAYLGFVQDNLDRLTFFTEYDAEALGLDWTLRQRDVWDGLAPHKFVPVWHEPWGAPLLRSMVEKHPNLGVPPVSPRTQNVLSSLVRRTRLNLHGLSFNHPYDEPGGLYSTLVSSSWISPTRFGETVIWDENRLRRYPTDEKEKIRRRHQAHFAQAGFDAEAILADDSTEVARYTIWAWRQMEQALEGPHRVRVIRRPSAIVTNGHVHPGLETRSPVVPEVAIDPAQGYPNGSFLPAPVEAVTRPLPVFDYRPVTSTVPNPDGAGMVEVTSQVAVMGTSGLRQCDSCSLAAVCPLFESGSSCKYAIPVEIRNRDQLLGILHSLLEMQGQRVAFAFFGEQLQGGYPDANLSSELDRFMRMTQSVKDIQDNRDFLKVTVEGRAQSGVLRRLFGAERAETLHRVDPDRAEDAVRRTMT
jgi:hypothetical protein